MAELKDKHAMCVIPQCILGNANLLVDTGADLNLIKINTLKDDIIVSTSKVQRMMGIANQLISTLGATTLTVANNGQNIETEFHVVPSDFLISGDGILGDLFLRDNKISINVAGDHITSMINDKTTIPARSEAIILVRLVKAHSSDQQNILAHAQ